MREVMWAAEMYWNNGAFGEGRNAFRGVSGNAPWARREMKRVARATTGHRCR